MTKAMIVDVTKCVGCYNCVLACKDEHVENEWLPYTKSQPHEKTFWMRQQEIERGSIKDRIPKIKMNWVAHTCMQCEDPPCAKAATNNAVYKMSDGTVVIDPIRSVGQQQLVASCPYGAIYWNQDLNIPQKCTWCHHLLDQGRTNPRCVDACPADALVFGEYDELKATIDQKSAVVLNPEYNAKPRVYYIGIPKTFIAGALVDGATGECLEGADVTCKDTAASTTFTAKSDIFGDFWLDGLDSGKTYDLTISKPGKTTWTKSVTLDRDVNLGDITL
jgi:tetrathionate reductase subunit B